MEYYSGEQRHKADELKKGAEEIEDKMAPSGMRDVQTATSVEEVEIVLRGRRKIWSSLPPRTTSGGLRPTPKTSPDSI